MAEEVEQQETTSTGSRCWPKITIDGVVGILVPFADGECAEVQIINTYAVLMGFLSMALRGLAFLVVTWTTVILLGGFVSVLGKKDFWCLAVITVAQTVGVFEVFLKEKSGNIWVAYQGLVGTMLASTVTTLELDSSDCLESLASFILWSFVGLAKAVVQALLFSIILLPLVGLYVLGPYICTALSLWRLIQRDYYGNRMTDGDVNLKPALDVVYSLSLAQSTIFCYKLMLARQEKNVVKLVSERCHFGESVVIDAVWDYLHKTKIGCEKDSSFARGRNFATYALDLIESRSPASYLSGLKIMDRLVNSSEHEMLTKQLIGLASSNHVLQKLLGTLDSGSPYDEEMKECAASIVEQLACDKNIRLDQFPGGIHCISSMLNTSQLLSVGQRILEYFAEDERNWRVMSNTQGFISTIMAPLGADRFHETDYCYTLFRIADLVSRLITAPGKTGVKARREISTSSEAIRAMESILKCDLCSKRWEHILAVDILTDVSLDKSTKEKFIGSFEDEKEENYIKIITRNFAQDKKHAMIRELAGEKLAKLSLESKASAMIILTVNDDVASDLTTVLLEAENNSCRTSAAEILTHLCSHYTKDKECFERLKKALADAMPKVLTELLSYGSTGEVQTGNEANSNGFSAPNIDLETGCATATQDGANKDMSSPADKKRKQDEDMKLKKSLLSLCSMVSNTLIIEDPDLARQLDEITASICFETVKPVMTFASVVKEAQELHEKKQAQDLEIVLAS